MSRLFSRFFLLACILLCMGARQALAQAPAAAGAASPAYVAGKIDLMEGDVRIVDKQNVPRKSKVGDKVYEGDSISTGANGEIHMTMDDEGFIAVRPNTKMRIAQYRAEGDDDDKGVISLVVGSLRSITGWIGKYHPKSYSINTPTATIGIRGTDHEPKVIPEGSSEGDAGTYDKVNAGGSFINTPQGNVDVTPNHAAFAPHNGAAAPRMLAAVPHFFQPTRNEHFIEGKHDQIQRIVQQRREERQQQIRSGLRPARPALNNNGRPGMNGAMNGNMRPGMNNAMNNGARPGMNNPMSNGVRPGMNNGARPGMNNAMNNGQRPGMNNAANNGARPTLLQRMQQAQQARTQGMQNRETGQPQGNPQQAHNQAGQNQPVQNQAGQRPAPQPAKQESPKKKDKDDKHR